MYIETQPPPTSLPNRFSKSVAKPSKTNALEQFCQLQVEQLAARSPIIYSQIVYYDSCFEQQQIVTAQTDSRLTPDILAYLRSEAWLLDFPIVLALTEIPCKLIPEKLYFCPIGYRNQAPEYILVVAEAALPSALQVDLVRSAALLIHHQELYLNHCHQTSEIQLLEQVVQRVGHQLRNPLGLISLYAESLCLRLSADHERDQAIAIRETVAELLTHLTELIQCGRSSHLRMTLQDLREVVQESIREMQPALQQKRIQVQYPDASILLMIDRFQIKQVFDNLLSNAIHYSPAGSAICLDWRSFQGEALIQITDQGVGIAPADLQKIFQPFYSKRASGIGLGLTIAKKIILDHQGQLWAQAQVEGGAQFLLTLPLSKP